jgi:hydroxymethylbilane synthase
MNIRVGSRSSPLALVQVQEVMSELKRHHPHISFELVSVDTCGDKDRTTSLRTLDKTDFFTREIDRMQLEHQCRISIHSAKDLPEPIAEGLIVAALTKGLDPADSLVLRDGETLATLKRGAVIATSSDRREEGVKEMRTDLKFMDLRGTISERLKKLDDGEADGVVVAEAALLRLGLGHLNRIKLNIPVAKHQGQLAVVVRKDDREMIDLFKCLDSRQKKKILYCGLEVPKSMSDIEYIHCPLIEIVPRKVLWDNTKKYTHIIFTSKTSVRLFCNITSERNFDVVAVGKATAQVAQEQGFRIIGIADDECAEGVVKVLRKINLTDARMLWPHAARARNVIKEYCQKNHIDLDELLLYDTVTKKPEQMTDLTKVDEVFFTSPSTVDAFIEVYGSLPNVPLRAIGRITEQYISGRSGH